MNYLGEENVRYSGQIPYLGIDEIAQKAEELQAKASRRHAAFARKI